MGKRRHYVKTSKCYNRLPTIEEVEELSVGTQCRKSTQAQSCSHNVVSTSPKVDLEDCTTWKIDTLKAKLAKITSKLRELRQTLEPPAKHLEEKIKQSYEEVMDFVNAKSKQTVECSFVGLSVANKWLPLLDNVIEDLKGRGYGDSFCRSTVSSEIEE